MRSGSMNIRGHGSLHNVLYRSLVNALDYSLKLKNKGV
jgi:hypothetical protein